MNVWKCQAAACPIVAMGDGDTVGLIAIGWHVAGSVHLCPLHRPEGRKESEERTKVYQQEALGGPPADVARFLDAGRGPLLLVTTEEGYSPAAVAETLRGIRGVASVIDASADWTGSWPMSPAALRRLRENTLGAVMAGWRVMYRLVPLVFTGGHLKLFQYPVKSPSLDAYDSLTALFREAEEKLQGTQTP